MSGTSAILSRGLAYGIELLTIQEKQTGNLVPNSWHPLQSGEPHRKGFGP